MAAAPERKQSLVRPEFLSQIRTMIVGYARVSTADQNPDMQERALRNAGADRVFVDRASGVQQNRPGLSDALRAVSSGDTLLVWKLDRLGRSLSHLINIVADLGHREVAFRSLTEGIDTSHAHERMVFQLMGSLAEFERTLIVERTQAGVNAARARGVKLGRRPSLDRTQLAHARALIASGERPAAVARTLQVGRSTLYRALASDG